MSPPSLLAPITNGSAASIETSPKSAGPRLAFRPDWVKAGITATVAGVLGQVALVWQPALGLEFFGRSAAQFAGLLTGCPVLRIDEGWLLPSVLPAVVTNACSGTTFFLMMAVMLGWHLGRCLRRSLLAVALALGIATALTIGINGLRVAAAIQASRWLNPLFPAAYGSLLHMIVGVAVFLPALIATNLICELYGRSRNTPTR